MIPRSDHIRMRRIEDEVYKDGVHEEEEDSQEKVVNLTRDKETCRNR